MEEETFGQRVKKLAEKARYLDMLDEENRNEK